MGQALHALGIDNMSVEDRIASELDKRLMEDDANPDDVIAWEAVKTEALARWQH